MEEKMFLPKFANFLKQIWYEIDMLAYFVATKREEGAFDPDVRLRLEVAKSAVRLFELAFFLALLISVCRALF